MSSTPEANPKSASPILDNTVSEEYEKLRFSLEEVHRQNPEFIVDEHMGAYVQRTGLHRAPTMDQGTGAISDLTQLEISLASIQSSVRKELGNSITMSSPKSTNHSQDETPVTPSPLTQSRPHFANAPTASEKTSFKSNFFHRLPTAGDHTKETAISSEVLHPRKLLNSSFTSSSTVKAIPDSHSIEIPTAALEQQHPPAIEGTPLRQELSSGSNALDDIDNKLDFMDVRPRVGPKIINPPEYTIDTSAGCGTVFLQCLDPSTSDNGTAFIVHRALLWLNSTTIFKCHQREKLFDIPTDEGSLRTVVNWLYYQNNINLDDYRTNRLCSVITISLILGIERLYNLTIKAIVKRHGGLCSQKFKPSKKVLKGVYDASDTTSRVRNLVGFLFAWGGATSFPGKETWEAEVRRDVELTVQKVRERGGWGAVNLNSFYVPRA